jgi:hypothetical protein
MKKILILSVVLMFASQMFGQKIDSYELQLPKVVFSGVNKIAVVGLEEGEKPTGIVDDFVKRMVSGLNMKSRGKTSKAEMYNPWLNTQLNVCQLESGKVSDLAAAKALVQSKGYDALMFVSLKAVEQYEAQASDVKAKTKEGLPYKQKVYQLKRVLSVSGKVQVIKLSDNSVMQAWNVDFDRKSEAKATDYESNSTLLSSRALMIDASKHLAANLTGQTCASLVLHKYHFKNIRKIKDKGQKALDKEISKLLKKNTKENLKFAYAKMKELAEKGFAEDEDNAKAYYNLGLLNELVGNYAEAKKCYEKCRQLDPTEKDYLKAMEHIEKLLELKAFIQQQGFELRDYEF